MRFTDSISLVGMLIVLTLLLHAARNGPVQPILRAMSLAEPVPTATITGDDADAIAQSPSGNTPDAPTATASTTRSENSATPPPTTSRVAFSLPIAADALPGPDQLFEPGELKLE